MKRILLSFAILAFAFTASAQDSKPVKVSIAANIGLPTTSGLSIAYGGDLQADFSVAPTTFITGSAGYEGYSVKHNGGSFGIIPILAGAKFFFSPDSKAYGHAQLGYAVSTSKGGGGAFAYAPSIGYYVSSNLDLSLKYLATSKNSNTTGSVNLRVAYNF